MEDFKELRNIIDSGLNKDSSHLLIILMEISSMTKSSEKGAELILEFVKYTWFSGSLLPLASIKLKIWNYVQHDLGFDPFNSETVVYFYVMFYFAILWTFNHLSENK